MMMNAAVDALRCAISHQNAWIRSAFTKWSRTKKANFPPLRVYIHTFTPDKGLAPERHFFRGFVSELPASVSMMVDWLKGESERGEGGGGVKGVCDLTPQHQRDPTTTTPPLHTTVLSPKKMVIQA